MHKRYYPVHKSTVLNPTTFPDVNLKEILCYQMRYFLNDNYEIALK